MRLIRLPGIKARTGLNSQTSIYKAINDGTLPKPVRVSARCVGWPEHEVDCLLHARAAGASDDEVRALVARLHAARVTEWKHIQATVGLSTEAAA